MRIEMVCFTEAGERLGERLSRLLAASDDPVRLTRLGAGQTSLRDWTAVRFETGVALVFIGAAGIAVRAVGPHLVSKTTDPAVVCLDDTGRFVIPLLSGHSGGANALAIRLAALLDATPVVTTATDIHGLFAVDAWASERGYHIQNPEGIKRVSAALLAGETVALYVNYPPQGLFSLEGELPKGIVLVEDESDAQLVIGLRPAPKGAAALYVTPPLLTLGVGCRSGTSAEALQAAFEQLCADENLAPQAFEQVCSIDVKASEPGLAGFCAGRGLPLRTFSAAALSAVPGRFSASDFVRATVGVDNVCERSAVLGSGGDLLVRKTTGRGLTLAVAVRPETIVFEREGAARG